MKKLLLSTLVFLAIAALQCAQGAIVIHKGSARTSFGTAVATTTETQKAYFIYDIPSALGRLIFVSTKNKTIVDAGARFYGFSRPKSGTKFYNFFVTSTSAFTTNIDFNASQTYLKGTETNLFLTSPTTGAFPYPRALSGLLTAIDGTSLATIATLSLSFDAKGTQERNTAGQSALQASQNIRGEFVAKGYTDLNPAVP